MISIVELSILTLNIWLVDKTIVAISKILKGFLSLHRGIPFVSKDRSIRVNAISKEIAKGDYDVVSLQEVSKVNRKAKLIL